MESIDELKGAISQVKEEISKVIIGQEEVIDLALVTILARSHALIEGVPGVAKTLLVRTIGRIMGREFGRIQFTPDLMPSDITGTNVFNFHKNEFNLQKGPIFTTFLLGDEINRAPAKTQAALLQSMQERVVTIDGKDYELPYDFTVFATQNPVEYEGTYPLPEAQKDRFLLKICMDYPDRDNERELAVKMLSGLSPENILESDEVKQLFSLDKLRASHRILNEVVIKDDIVDYILNIVRGTRNSDPILVGAGPRATQSMILASRALAVIHGRDFVIPDDVKSLAVPVLAHRLILRAEYEVEGMTPSDVLSEILDEVSVPR